MSIDTALLESIGLTQGEVKVYLALLELGAVSVSPLAKNSGVTTSKIYPITDRLIEKGLVSFTVRNNVKMFSATSPSRIKEYLDAKQALIERQRVELDKALPLLEARQKAFSAQTLSEVLVGWKGLQAAYEEMLTTLKPGETDYVIGASAGTQYEKTKKFYEGILLRGAQRKIRFRVISQERIRSHFEEYQGPKQHVVRRYISLATHSETNVYADTVLIVIHAEEPMVIKIKNRAVADSYKAFFETLWKAAKK